MPQLVTTDLAEALPSMKRRHFLDDYVAHRDELLDQQLHGMEMGTRDSEKEWEDGWELVR